MKLDLRYSFPSFMWFGTLLISPLLLILTGKFIEGIYFWSISDFSLLPVLFFLGFLISAPIFSVFIIAFNICDGLEINALLFRLIIIVIIVLSAFGIFYWLGMPAEFYYSYGCGIVLSALLFRMEKIKLPAD